MKNLNYSTRLYKIYVNIHSSDDEDLDKLLNLAKKLIIVNPLILSPWIFLTELMVRKGLYCDFLKCINSFPLNYYEEKLKHQFLNTVTKLCLEIIKMVGWDHFLIFRHEVFLDLGHLSFKESNCICESWLESHIQNIWVQLNEYKKIVEQIYLDPFISLNLLFESKNDLSRFIEIARSINSNDQFILNFLLNNLELGNLDIDTRLTMLQFDIFCEKNKLSHALLSLDNFISNTDSSQLSPILKGKLKKLFVKYGFEESQDVFNVLNLKTRTLFMNILIESFSS